MLAMATSCSHKSYLKTRENGSHSYLMFTQVFVSINKRIPIKLYVIQYMYNLNGYPL